MYWRLCTNVIHLIWRLARAWVRIAAIPVFIRFSHIIKRANHALNDIIDIGEITTVIAVVVNLYCFAFQNGFSELEKRHIWAPPRAVHGEKAQPSCRQVIQMAISVSH